MEWRGRTNGSGNQLSRQTRGASIVYFRSTGSMKTVKKRHDIHLERRTDSNSIIVLALEFYRTEKERKSRREGKVDPIKLKDLFEK